MHSINRQFFYQHRYQFCIYVDKGNEKNSFFCNAGINFHSLYFLMFIVHIARMQGLCSLCKFNVSQ